MGIRGIMAAAAGVVVVEFAEGRMFRPGRLAPGWGPMGGVRGNLAVGRDY